MADDGVRSEPGSNAGDDDQDDRNVTPTSAITLPVRGTVAIAVLDVGRDVRPCAPEQRGALGNAIAMTSKTTPRCSTQSVSVTHEALAKM